MAQRFEEARLACDFADAWLVTKYDEWAFYRKQFQVACLGNKGVDFLALDPEYANLWLIEMKDYRQGPRDPDKLDLWEEVAVKMRDTLAGLVAAKIAAAEAEEKQFAGQALSARRIFVILHLEQPAQHSKIFPRIFNPADVQQRLRQLVKPIDAHPRVIELSTHQQRVPWQVVSLPAPAP